MELRRTAQHASELGARTQALMEARAIAPHPANYRLCYAYLAGDDAALAAAVDTALGGDADRREARLAEIHRRFFAPTNGTAAAIAELAGALGDVQAALRAAVAAPCPERDAAVACHGLTQRIERAARTVNSLRARLDESSGPLPGRPAIAPDAAAALDDRLSEAMREAADTGGRLSLLLVDIDGFETIERSLGRDAGERVLALVGSALHDTLKRRDTALRCPQDSFAVLLPATGMDGAVRAGRAVCKHIAALTVGFDGLAPRPGRITVSIGAAEAAEGEPAATVIERADDACELARRLGGNRVISERHVGDHELALIC